MFVFILEEVHNPSKAMKDLLKIAGVFAVIYIVWNIFWRTTFAIHDSMGAGTMFAIALVLLVAYRLFGNSDH